MRRLIQIAFFFALASSALHAQTKNFDHEILQNYCIRCHGEKPEKIKGDFNLLLLNKKNHFPVREWERVLLQMQQGLMPPIESRQPKTAARKQLITQLEQRIDSHYRSLPESAGIALTRRLSRAEYINSLKQILPGVAIEKLIHLADDEVGNGFDNMASLQSSSPLHVEKYLQNATAVVDAAILDDPRPKPTLLVQTARELKNSAKGGIQGSFLSMWTNGVATANFNIPADGRYQVRISAAGTPCKNEWPKMQVKKDSQAPLLKEFTVNSRSGKAKTYSLEIELKKGMRNLELHFINDAWDPKASDKSQRDCNLMIEWIELKQLNAQAKILPASHQQVIIAVPSKKLTEKLAMQRVLLNFAQKAWRSHKVTTLQLASYEKLFNQSRKQGRNYWQAIKVPLRAMLVSPHFLYRMEVAPPAGTTQLLSGEELANRLSYLIWSAAPDAELLRLAKSGTLQDKEVLRKQTIRLLRDVKAQGFANNFAMQWLQVNRLQRHQVDAKLFPSFNEGLRQSMLAEIREFFLHNLRNNLPTRALLSSDIAWVNKPLAKHYGLQQQVSGEKFQQVKLKNEVHQGGLLSMAAILTATADSDRSLPVRRGKWILEQILALPLPPPPADAGSLPEQKKSQNLSVSERLRLHRQDPDCASCHLSMDPIGFSFEQFDAIGRLRKNTDLKAASGKLPDGREFQGFDSLKKLLLQEPRPFARVYTERLMTYALGRELEETDIKSLLMILDQAKSKNYRLGDLLIFLVQSKVFRYKSATTTQSKERSP